LGNERSLYAVLNARNLLMSPCTDFIYPLYSIDVRGIKHGGVRCYGSFKNVNYIVCDKSDAYNG